MHNAPILGLALALLSTASAFVIPANQADGLYQVRRDLSGSEMHEALKAPPSRRDTGTLAAAAAPHQLGKRDNLGAVHCGCGFGMVPGDTDAAVADLKSQLDNDPWIDAGLAYYSIRGDTVAFVCNDDHNAPLMAWADEVGRALQQVTDACGLYVAGSTGGFYGDSIGYMRNSDGLDFCAASLSSPSDQC